MSRNLKRGALRRRNVAASALLASTMLTAAQVAFAQQQTADSGNALPEIVVTAQKRSENLQNVPISIQALGETKIEQLNIDNFDDYAKFLPSVTYQKAQPGQTSIYMRGIESGGTANHSGPLPSVGLYLDEIPVTTIAGQLDVHVYDVSRIEALAGPQGTLYGASSQSGTVRIISNPPDASGFSASYDVEISTMKNGALGNVGEGYVNIPLSSKAAIRIVGWQQHQDGFIDNVHSTLTFPSSGITINNSGLAKNGYNDTDTYGGRAALKVDLSDDWTVTGSIMGQDLSSNGIPAFDPSVGDLKVAHFYPETNHDRFTLFGLTVQGKIGDFDVTYAGGGLIRDIDSQSDYTDYSFFYDKLLGYGKYFHDNAGNLINPSQRILGTDHFTKQSHELRIASPATDRFRVVGGLFLQRQEHYITQNYKIDGLADNNAQAGVTPLSVDLNPGSIWLTQQLRTDRDQAAFGEMSYDITPDLTATGGVRVFRADNSLQGFFGFNSNFSSHTGEVNCFLPAQPYSGAPCENLNKEVKEINATYKANLTYKVDADKLVYATASSGFRPGGVNRASTFAPYSSDTIYNYEIGWKTSWLDKKLRWNGALFWDNWDNVQFAYLGPNSLTIVANANTALSRGLESDLTWKTTDHLTLSGALAVTDAHLTDKVCNTSDPITNKSTLNCSGQPPSGDLGTPAIAASRTAQFVAAPDGRQLPMTPYVKGNMTARYDFNVSDATSAFVQSSVVFTGGSWADLRTLDREALGRQPSFTTVDLSAGVAFDDKTFKLFVKNLFDERGQLWRYAECTPAVCAGKTYVLPTQPFTIGVKFGQVF